MVFVDAIVDAAIDCAKLVPFLFITILVMEWVEHSAGDRFAVAIEKAGRFGPVAGAALGIVPQCGFSAACAHLFNGGLVSAGTLAAVFLSTSDEALPILLANPAGFSAVWKLVLVKLIVAVPGGLLLDAIWPIGRQRAAYESHEHPHVCSADEQPTHIFVAALKRTGSILLFLFLVTLTLNIVIKFIGYDRLAAGLLPGFFQPFLAALIGMIPNCAASVLLTQLYLDGMLTFGSAVAGLCTAAGVGLLVLLKGDRGALTYLKVLGFVAAVAVLAGTVLQLLA